ncbi:MAG TPA: MBL fold metallo-hydrolase, partial [Stellaceae bacterium]|nr:MBL fold metallo-hydrolase [Stellaceae bacterium]
LVYKLNGGDIARIKVTDVTANPAIAADAFAIPDTARAAAKPPATGTVPYQWVLRRLNIYRFIDSDAVNYDAAANPGGLKLVELAPNVQQVVGGSANDLIVAMKDYLVVFDAPVNEWQSRWVIDAAKAKYPGKPIKYLVLTHHHMDHTGGARTYVAEGATIIVPAPDKAHFAKDFAGKRTVNPDALAKHPRAAKITEVADKLVLKNGDDELRLFNIENPHVKGMLIGYDAKADLVWVTDLWSPGRDKNKGPGNIALHDALAKLGLHPARFAGGHGGNGTSAELEEVVAQK